VSCNFCIGELNRGLPLSCMANPTAGREATWSDSDYGTADTRRRVLVVGGGPAGLEAARVAAERGHEVHLWERESELGGRLRTAARGVGRSDLNKLVTYERAQLERLGVEVVLKKEATAEAIAALEPDVVVQATGSVPHEEIALEGDVLDANDLIADTTLAGRSVAVLDFEGAWRAASVSETLATAGHHVRLLSPGPGLLWDINSYSQMLILERLRQADVEFFTLTRVLSWDGKTLTFKDGTAEQKTLTDVDSVCVVSPGAPAPAPITTTADFDIEIIGDALAPRDLLQVVYQGHELGRRL